MMRVLFAAPDSLWPDWATVLTRLAPEMDLVREAVDGRTGY